MRLPIGALGRAKGVRRPADGLAAAAPGVRISVTDLVALEAAARDFGFLPRQPVHSLLAGRHASRVRGRGLAFEDLRHYLPGDDVRTIDWRVTARTGEPFVRVYTEEKDRPALFVVDQRINMFFGTRRAMKSVVAAEGAALGAWRVLAQGDRVGGFVFNDSIAAADGVTLVARTWRASGRRAARERCARRRHRGAGGCGAAADAAADPTGRRHEIPR